MKDHSRDDSTLYYTDKLNKCLRNKNFNMVETTRSGGVLAE